MRIIFCGSRHWTDRQAIRHELESLPPDTIIVHGACQGADLIAAELATELGLEVEAHPAQWDVNGPAAGPLRNQAMLKAGADRVIAFAESLRDSKGTRDMVSRARRAGLPVRVVGIGRKAEWDGRQWVVEQA